MDGKARYMSLAQLNPEGADQLFCDLGKFSYLNITYQCVSCHILVICASGITIFVALCM